MPPALYKQTHLSNVAGLYWNGVPSGLVIGFSVTRLQYAAIEVSVNVPWMTGAMSANRKYANSRSGSLLFVLSMFLPPLSKFPPLAFGKSKISMLREAVHSDIMERLKKKAPHKLWWTGTRRRRGFLGGIFGPILQEREGVTAEEISESI